MARSMKDGRKGGAHRGGHWGKEYWSKRPGPPMMSPGKDSKRITHRAERARRRKEEYEAMHPRFEELDLEEDMLLDYDDEYYDDYPYEPYEPYEPAPRYTEDAKYSDWLEDEEPHCRTCTCFMPRGH